MEKIFNTKEIMQLQKSKAVSFSFALTPYKIRQQILLDLAQLILDNTNNILAANNKDLALMEVNNPLYDRLLLNEKRIQEIAAACIAVAKQEDVLNKILDEKKMAAGMILKKISVPIGVIACIYEARPNVTIDIAVLGIFTGNTVILRGSSQAENSNKILIEIIHQALKKNNIPLEVVSAYSLDRDDLDLLFTATNEVDLLIPRGGKNLINLVRQKSLIPVIETGAGVCHTVVDTSADIDMAIKIIVNAKTQRPSVCNALDCLLVQDGIKDIFWDKLLASLQDWQVKIWADDQALFNLLIAEKKIKSNLMMEIATLDIWGTEFLGYEMAVKTFKTIEMAIDHINEYGSRHSESIISTNNDHVNQFFSLVDASSVYHNASTRFTDGGCFGLGAEIGISTQKLHARGPMGANSLTTYKYLIIGNGEIR